MRTLLTIALLASTTAVSASAAEGNFISKNLRYTQAALSRASQSAGVANEGPLLLNLIRQAPGLRYNVLKLAFDASRNALKQGQVKRGDLLTVIDYTLPSSQPRLFVFDLAAQRLLFRELVAHGRNSGDDRATFFSNSPESLASSLGLFVTADPYVGSNGYSLRLKGLDSGVNDKAWDRHIVMHGASYVSAATIRVLGRLGRSWGCPAVRPEIARTMIDRLRGGSPVFAYYSAQG